VGGMLGLDAEPADFSFPVPRAASERIAHLLERHGAGANLLTMAAGTIWETKHWRTEGFAEVADHKERSG